MLYYFSTTVLFFVLCLSYAGYVLLARITVQKRMRELGFRVRMLTRNRASHLGVLLNAHPLWLFFCDRLSVELEREPVAWSTSTEFTRPTIGAVRCFFPLLGSSC